MRNGRLERELELILLLTGNHTHKVDDICGKLNISPRTFYYYIEFFRDCNFDVFHDGPYYSLGQGSVYFKRLMGNVGFTREEAMAVTAVLEGREPPCPPEGASPLLESVKSKLVRFYKLDRDVSSEESEESARKISLLHDSIRQRLMVVLKGYSSPHSQTLKDRLVEPFLMMNNNQEVRCYEPASGMNKTFKVARMTDVEPLATTWLNERMHRKMHTDVFMFSSEEQEQVRLLMGMLSHNVMVEEYPRTRGLFKQQEDGRWLLELKVCSFKGVGRFVLGLYDDIEVLGNSAFKEYLLVRIKEMYASVLHKK
jgi:predicted DNA-binding transcriptional regulator YafY